MPTYNPYTIYTSPPTMQDTQSTVVRGHKVVCAQPPQPSGSAMSIDSGFVGSLGSLFTPYIPPVSPMYSSGCPSSSENPPPLRRNACIPLPPLSQLSVAINPLLEKETIPQIKYDIRLPPSLATSRRHLVDDDRWRCEPASNPNAGSLTIRMTHVSKPVVVFPASVDDEIVTIQDVLLAVHYAVRASAPDDRRCRSRHRQGELWRQETPRPYRNYDHKNMEAECCEWAGLTRSPTESDVWILMTT